MRAARKPDNGGREVSLNARDFRRARFPKVSVSRVDEGEDDEEEGGEERWHCFKHVTPTGGASLALGTLEECEAAAVASGLPWTDVALGTRRLPDVSDDEDEGEEAGR